MIDGAASEARISRLATATRRPSGEPPPLPRQLGRGTIAWWVGFGSWAVLWMVAFVSQRSGEWITDRDLDVMRPIVGHRLDRLTPMMQAINTLNEHWLTAAVGWITIAIGLATRRIRHVVLLVGALGATAAIATVVGVLIARPRPLDVEIIGEWHGFAQPSRPLALAATALTAAVLTTTRRGPQRRWAVVVATGTLCVAALAQVYVGVEHPTDSAAGITLGVAVALAAFRVGAPESVFPIGPRTGRSAHLDVSGAHGRAIVAAVGAQMGAHVVAVTPVALSGSAGSTPLRLLLADGTSWFAKLYARSHLRADRFYKLGRTLRYGQLEDEHRFSTVRRLVQHEDHMLRLFQAAGIAVPSPLGIVELTPEREYLLVAEFLDGAIELDAAAAAGIAADPAATDAIVDQGLEFVDRLWRAGLAHRDLKPSNLMVRDGRLFLVVVAFATVRPSPWRQAVDLANMMLALGLVSHATTVHARARRWFSDDELAEAFAACRGVTIPGQLRQRLAGRDGDLVGEFRALVPVRPQVAIQRWSVRRTALTVWVLAVSALATLAAIGNLGEIGLVP